MPIHHIESFNILENFPKRYVKIKANETKISVQSIANITNYLNPCLDFIKYLLLLCAHKNVQKTIYRINKHANVWKYM